MLLKLVLLVHGPQLVTLLRDPRMVQKATLPQCLIIPIVLLEQTLKKVQPWSVLSVQQPKVGERQLKQL